MRLNSEQIATIRETVQAVAGHDAEAIVFGSRLLDQARGGDLDVLVRSDRGLELRQRARIKMLLERALCLPVDVIACQRGVEATPFQAIALAQGVRL
jgi:predicted nucleotidyltransferase